MGYMFGFMDLLFPIFFIIIFIIIGISLIKGIKEWSYNNSQPKIPAEVVVVSKRQNISVHHDTDNMHRSTSTTYYITFVFLNGDRIELKIPSSEYGLIAEKDRGTLISQGSRFISFERS